MSDGPDGGDGGLGLDGDYGIGIDGDFGGIDAFDGLDGGLDGDVIADALMLTHGPGADFGHGSCSPHGGMAQSHCATSSRSGSDSQANSFGIERDRGNSVNRENRESKVFTDEQLAALQKVAEDPERKLFGVHVVAHGACSPELAFARAAERRGLVRIDTVTPNFAGMDLLQPEISDWNIWSPPYPRRKLPAGYYRDATGTTRVIRQYWQIKRKFSFWERPKNDWRFDRFQFTLLDVSMVQWYYREIGDCETRISINVLSLPIFDKIEKEWGYLKDSFLKHQRAAREISEEIFEHFRATQSHPLAVLNRSKIVDRGGVIYRTSSGVSDNSRNGAHKVTPPPHIVLPSTPMLVTPSKASVAPVGVPRSQGSDQSGEELVKVVLRLPVRKSDGASGLPG